MKALFLTLTILFSLIIFSGCGDENPVNEDTPTEDPGLSWLSGNWSGTLTMIQDGECTISGSDSLTSNITITIAVTSDGGVTVTESFFESEWSGIVSNSLGFYLTKIVTFERGQTMAIASCADSIVVDTVGYPGTFTEEANSVYRLIMQQRENWCPSSNCGFLVRYNVTRTCHP